MQDNGQDGFGLEVAVPAAELARLQRRVRFLEAALGQTLREDGQLREWFTAGELAEMRLPGLPTTRQGIAMAAKARRWPTRRDREPGDGRRLYHFSGLPHRAFDALIERVLRSGAARPAPERLAAAPAAPEPALPLAPAAATPPWMLPLLRMVRGGKVPLEAAMERLPAQLGAGVRCPTLDEAGAVLRSWEWERDEDGDHG